MTFLEVQIQYNSRKPSLIWPIRAGEGSILSAWLPIRFRWNSRNLSATWDGVERRNNLHICIAWVDRRRVNRGQINLQNVDHKCISSWVHPHTAHWHTSCCCSITVFRNCTHLQTLRLAASSKPPCSGLSCACGDVCYKCTRASHSRFLLENRRQIWDFSCNSLEHNAPRFIGASAK